MDNRVASPFLDRYHELVESMSARHSADSNTVVVVMMEYLRALHEHALTTPDGTAELASAITSIVADIRDSYARAEPPASPLPRRVVAGYPRLYVFDGATYAQRYGSLRFAPADIAVEVGTDAFATVEPGRTYLYAIDDRHRLVVCPTPLTVDDLLLQENPRVNGMEVFHAMLVPERLTVAAAGEITFFGDGTVRSVVANLKSGHFRPEPTTVDWLAIRLRTLFPAVRLMTLVPIEIGTAWRADAALAALPAPVG
jgi:hypothetical protein